MRLADVPFELTRPVEPVPPPLRDLWGAATARREAWRFHVHQPVQALGEALLHGAMHRLPLDLASDIGARLSRGARRRMRGRPFVKRMARMLARLDSDRAGTPAAQAALLDRWFENTGRAYAEFAVLHRLPSDGRVVVEGMEHVQAAIAARGQVALALCHLGAWETVGPVVPGLLGRPVVYTWQPQPNRFHNRVLWQRRRAEGTIALPPGAASARLLRRLVVEGRESFGLFVDEVVDGASRFPPFWRPMPERGNATVLLKLAHRVAAPVLPVWVLRTGRARFTVHVDPPLALDARAPLRAVLDEGRRQLAARLEPVIRANPEQWYMLAEMREPPRR